MEIEALYKRLFGRALLLTNCSTQAADLVQDTFVKCLEKQIETKDEGYYFTTLYSLFINDYRKYKNIHFVSLSEKIRDSEETIGRDFDWKMLNKLTHGEREAILMHYKYGLKYHEIHEATGRNVISIRTRSHQGKIKLRSMIKSI